MRTLLSVLSIGLLAAAVQSGCADRSPPPERMAVPPPDRVSMREPDEIKPLPEQPEYRLPPPPYNDVPLVSQRPPEQRAFVDAYQKVGRPRIMVFVNRTLEGAIVPVNPDEPAATVEHRIQTNTGVNVDSHSSQHDYGYYRDASTSTDRKFESKGPVDYHETTDVYLHPGQYDEAWAKSLDYEAVENVLTDWLSADGQVAIVSPLMARQRLSEDEVRDLQSGRPRMLGEVARQLNSDILVQVQAHPTHQTPEGLEVRLVAEAVNIKGGESIARAVLDVPPPLDKQQINKYTRFMARKLMDGMIGSWSAYSGSPVPAAADRPPARVPGPEERPPAPVPPVLPQTGPSAAPQ